MNAFGRYITLQRNQQIFVYILNIKAIIIILNCELDLLQLYNNSMLNRGITYMELNALIQRLLSEKNGYDVKMSEDEVKAVCLAAREIFLSQPTLLQLKGPIKVVGDIHGQFQDLVKIFEYGGFPPAKNYLFLGDYVDRGKQSIQTIVLLLCFKIKYPQKFFLLRGNHEAAEINKIYGFYDECKRKFSTKIWKIFTDCFNTMPISAVIQGRILCMHGGLSPELSNVQTIATINRPTEVPKEGILCDLLWSDPAEQEQTGWRQNKTRGAGYIFGVDVLSQFLKENDLDLICRAHQVVQDGYQFFGNKQLVTIFSAPNYGGVFENWGAVLNIDEDLICSFHIIKPEIKKSKSRDTKKRPKIPKYYN